MSLDNIMSVDALGISKVDGAAILTLFDGDDWNEEMQHLYALQEKINAYFNFIESGQLYKTYPAAIGRSIRIEVIHRCELPEHGRRLLAMANSTAAELDATVVAEHKPRFK